MKRFRGKKVYITGGSSGIGLALARRLADAGADIMLFARNRARLDEARLIVDGARRAGGRTAVMPLDVGDGTAVREVMDRAADEFGPPDILITSAGIGMADYFENITDSSFDEVMRINLHGTRNAVAVLLPYLKERDGHIVIISSLAGHLGMFGYTAYGTSKFALVGFAECLRAEMKRHGVRVSIACPPETDTPFVAEESGTIPPEARAVKDLAGILSPEYVARKILAGVGRNRYMIIPGFRARALYYMNRVLPGAVTRFFADMTAARAGS